MQFLVEWQDDAVNVALEERATVADFRLLLGLANVCSHTRGDRVIDHLTIPLYALAEGLAHEWWRLFGARDQGVSLVDYRAGYAVPDIRMRFDGAAFEISAHQRVYLNPDLRFWEGPSEVMSRSDAEERLGGFIELVLDRLVEHGSNETSAALRWARIQASRQDADDAAFCEAAGALGVDPYQIDDAVADTIERASGMFEGESLTELLAGAQTADRKRLMDWVERVERRAPDRSLVADLRAIAEQVAVENRSRGDLRSWAVGYRCARAFRRAVATTGATEFRTFRQLAEILGASGSFDLAPQVDGIRLLRTDGDDGAHIHLRAHGSSEEAHASHLFTFARGVGDVVCFPDPGRAPVNDLRSAYRQAAGRAFAAEFLAPVNEVMSMRRDGRDAVSIAERFAVSTVVIERQIENASRVEEACA